MNKCSYIGTSRIVRVSSFLNKIKLEPKFNNYSASAVYTTRMSCEIDFNGEYGGKTVAGCFMYFSYRNRRWNPIKQVVLMDSLANRSGIYGGFATLTTIVSHVALRLGTRVLTRVGDGSLGRYYIQHLSQEYDKFGSSLIGLWRYPFNGSVVCFPIASFLSSSVFVLHNPSEVCYTDVGLQYIDAYYNELKSDKSLSKMLRCIDMFENTLSGSNVLLFGDDVYGKHASKDVVYLRAFFKVMKQGSQRNGFIKRQLNLKVDDAYKSLKKVSDVKRIIGGGQS